MLHVTNGSAFVEMLAEAGINGETLPWDDVLMHGPVPGGLDAPTLAETRSRFIRSCGWADDRDVSAGFHVRDERFSDALKSGDPIVLWFEPDLHDQLQLIQILDRVHAVEGTHTGVELVQADILFGSMRPSDLPGWYDRRVSVTADQIRLAVDAFAAFRDIDPGKLASLLDADLAALPFLRPAVVRLFQEYPDLATGLTRNERQALHAIAAQPRPGGRVFQAAIEAETYPYEGDLGFLLSLERLLGNGEPLIAFADRQAAAYAGPGEFPWRSPLEATELGLRVANGGTQWRRPENEHLWRGGVCISAEAPWRYDAAKGQPVRTPN